MSLSTLTSKGQVTVPKIIREKLNLHSGDKLDFQVDNSGAFTVTPVNKKVEDVFGILSDKSQVSVSVDDMKSELENAFRNGRL